MKFLLQKPRREKNETDNKVHMLREHIVSRMSSYFPMAVIQLPALNLNYETVHKVQTTQKFGFKNKTNRTTAEVPPWNYYWGLKPRDSPFDFRSNNCYDAMFSKNLLVCLTAHFIIVCQQIMLTTEIANYTCVIRVWPDCV